MAELAELAEDNGVSSPQVRARAGGKPFPGSRPSPPVTLRLQTYGTDPTAGATWDADHVQGCLCDPGGHTFGEGVAGKAPGAIAYDCSQRAWR